VTDAWIRALVALPFGLVFGSFLSVVVARVPARESLVHPRSHCPVCGAEIATRDNIPVLSWLLLRGRCRSCGAHISFRYPLLELATGVVFAGTAVAHDRVFPIVVLCAFGAVMIAVAAIDLEHRIIPNRITYPGLVVFTLAILVGWLIGEPLSLARAIVGAVAYGGSFLLIAVIAPRGLGMGDVKLTALIGLVMGSLDLRFVAVAAGVAILLGGLGGILALLSGRGRKSAIPFGPFLSAGAVAATLWGSPIAHWYLRSVT
jgi:leader peptidase (prepilin peptidase)/N-methyltransferase